MINGKIGVIGAMRVEIETLAAALTDAKTEQIGSMTFYTGKFGDREVVLAVCGIGKVFAAMCAQTMILHYGVQAILNTGVAGTLSDKLSIGDIAVSADVVEHDMDTSPIGDPIGLISGLNMVYMPADVPMVVDVTDAITEKGGKFLVGTIASGDVFVADAAKKSWITEKFGAIACEMEGAAVGQVCTANGVPFVVIRAISDGGNEEAKMDYPTFVKMAAARSAEIVKIVLSK